MVLLRVAIFVIVGAAVMGLNKAMGTDAAVLPWAFVLGGLGAVAAVDVIYWWHQRSR